MAELVCEVCGSTEDIGTYQGYGLNQKLCERCAGFVLRAQNAKETEILQAHATEVVTAIEEEKARLRLGRDEGDVIDKIEGEVSGEIT